MNYLKTAWESIKIPEPLFSFFSMLYNFDTESFASSCQVVGVRDDAEKTSEAESDVSSSKCQQMLALFQIMFYNLHNGRSRTPPHVLNNQAVYATCKSATLITSFNRFGLCTSYHEVIRNHTAMASFIVESCEDGVSFPRDVVPSQITMAAFDHEEAMLSGNGGSCVTVTVLFQRTKPNISETTIQHGEKKTLCTRNCRNFVNLQKNTDLQANYQVAWIYWML